MSAESSGIDLVQMINNVPAWTDLAARHGPFFFGVFLVIVAFALIVLDKIRWYYFFVAVCGILFMAWASLLFGKPIHAYTIRIDNLAKNQSVALTDSVPRLYRHNLVHDVERDSYHVDLVTVSPVKLEKGRELEVIIVEARTLTKPDNTTEVVTIKYQAAIHFKGEAYSTYNLQRIESKDEEGAVRYKLAKNTWTEERRNVSAWFQDLLCPIAHAEEMRYDVLPYSSFRNQIAQAGTGSLRVQGTAGTVNEGDPGMTIIYRERPADQGKVRSALSKKGIRYLIETGKRPEACNAVWVGREVPGEAAELIGNALLAEGVELRYFGYFSDPGAKTNIIQIGHSKDSINNNSITREDIATFTQVVASKQRESQKLRVQQQESNRALDLRIHQQQQQQQQR
jgi:hypothetical protein